METRLGRVVILVKDYEEAFSFYERNFFCKKLFDSTSPDGQRYLHICFSQDDHIGIWFLKSEADKVGMQTAGQPTLVIYTNEIISLYEHVRKNGVEIIEELVTMPESKYFHCCDLYGNRIIVVELSGNQ